MNRTVHPVSPEDVARFERYVEKGPGCWGWTGGGSNPERGVARGAFFVHGENFSASRIAWVIANGREPNGDVCHSCDNPNCVNPEHLWLGTHTDNMRDMTAKGRHWRQRATHCPRGHEYTAENTLPRKDGRRNCRECKRLSQEVRNRSVARWAKVGPDLYEALDALFKSYKELADSGDAGFWSIEDQPEGKQALAALAKARGETA